MRTCLVALLVASFLTIESMSAQQSYPSNFSTDLAAVPSVRDALSYVDDNFDTQVDEWIRITEIPAQSRHEKVRGEYLRGQLELLGLEVSVDSIGNVIAKRPGTGDGPAIVFAAHIDTVHSLDADHTVTRADGRLHAPGIFDNSASVTNMLTAARAMFAANVQTKGDVYFIGTVQEELGLQGMKYWLDHNPVVTDMLVALDGGIGTVSYGALGIYWSRMVFSAEGSHTVSSRGKPHPARAASRCILGIYEIPLPDRNAPVSAVYNVGIVEGGEVVNAIPQVVSFTVDLRTVDPVLLEHLDTTIVNTCAEAAQEERVEFRREVISQSPAGGTPDQLADRREHPIVQTAVDVLKYLGHDFGNRPAARASGSTDSNAGVVRGIPSISVGRAYGGNQHTLTEWSDIESARIGTKQIILLTAALAELAPEGVSQ
jgi:acetylornithine deacetylase/succinyl-diaminopimelate desuccinylase-like protein